MKILVRMPNWVGDVVMATPALRALRRAYPEAELVLGLKAYVAPLLEGWELIDRQLVLPASRRERIDAFRQESFDICVLLTNSLGTAYEAWRSRIPRRIGYRGDARRWLLSESLPRPRGSNRRKKPLPMARLYASLLEPLGVTTEDFAYELPVSEADEVWALEWLTNQGWREGEALIGLSPGARFGASKLWRAERFAAAGSSLAAAEGLRCVVLTGPGEERLREGIVAAMDQAPLGATGAILPLGPLKALVRRLRLLITTDAGPRAIAQALGTPNVVVMGPTHPGWTAIQNERAVIVRHDVPCGPCHLEICPTDHACMEQIEVSEVLEASNRLLRSRDIV